GADSGRRQTGAAVGRAGVSETMNRRAFLKSSGLALVAGPLLPNVIVRMASAATTKGRKVLVAVFQRGAVDGLNVVVPHGEKAYYDARPTIAVPKNEVLDLDGFFGLHPALAPLVPLFKDKSAPIGNSLKQIAQLIKSNVGLEVAFTDVGGWDTHAGEGGAQGQLANNLRNFSAAIAAFAQDLGSRMSDVVLVTMSEFGRTVRENGNRGTD